jgi:hypothetical protein
LITVPLDSPDHQVNLKVVPSHRVKIKKRLIFSGEGKYIKTKVAKSES